VTEETYKNKKIVRKVGAVGYTTHEQPNTYHPKETTVPSNNPDPTGPQFIFDKPIEELTPKEKSIAALRKFTPEGRALGRQKQVETQMLDRQLRMNFKRNAKAYSKILGDIPDLGALDVIRLCIHLALQENDYETAARWAKELAEYEKPKLQRIEKVVKNEAENMSNEELMALAMKEGLLPTGALMKLPEIEPGVSRSIRNDH